MSNYPPPPNGNAASDAAPQTQEAIAAAPTTSAALLEPVIENATTTTPFEPLHHGLEALQAAVAEPLTPPRASAQTQQPQPQLQSQSQPQPQPQAQLQSQPEQASRPEQSASHYAMGPGPPSTPVPLAAPQPKMTRLRRACDMCSRRKVKCDDSGPPCGPCQDLSLECTMNREMKRRGPPNKHAQAAKVGKRPRLEPRLSPSPSHAAETLVSISAPESATLDAEMIAPLPVLGLFVDDFFTYIHPLIPFPHEPSFRQSFANREDRTSREFLALLSSMIGCLVASFPRSAREHLKSMRSANHLPPGITLIDRCRAVALEARGVGFDNKREMTVYDAATSYFLGLAAGHTLQWHLFRRFMNQTLGIIRELGFHTKRDEVQNYAAEHLGQQQPRPVDHIKEEVGRRVFWVLFLGVRSMAQLGAPSSELMIPPHTVAEPYPDLPMEIDDQYIMADVVHPQPAGTISLLVGFNECVRIYLTMSPIHSAELCYGFGSLAWADQRRILDDALQAAKQVTGNLPPELQLSNNSEGVALLDANSDLEKAGYQYCPKAFPTGQPAHEIRYILSSQPTKRRSAQFEIQKANIFVSQLATRSYYVEKYLNLYEIFLENQKRQREEEAAAAPNAKAKTTGGSYADANAKEAEIPITGPQIDDPETSVVTISIEGERETIVQNLLTVLGFVSRFNMETNGVSLISKIRQVASTLLEARPERKGPVAKKAEEYLHQFLEILMKLEKTGRSLSVGADWAAGGGGDVNEGEELRAWADLEEYQVKFAGSWGVLA